jgi:hypothetical protein
MVQEQTSVPNTTGRVSPDRLAVEIEGSVELGVTTRWRPQLAAILTQARKSVHS